MNERSKRRLMLLAMKEAQKAIESGNPPFGAVLADRTGKVVAVSHNTQASSNDPTAHAEINVFRKAGRKLGTRYLEGYHVFTNAEPCSMCMSAGIKALIADFHFGAMHEPAMDPELSAFEVASKAKRRVRVEGGILERECIAQIREGRAKLKGSGPDL